MGGSNPEPDDPAWPAAPTTAESTSPKSPARRREPAQRLAALIMGGMLGLHLVLPFRHNASSSCLLAAFLSLHVPPATSPPFPYPQAEYLLIISKCRAIVDNSCSLHQVELLAGIFRTLPPR
jgi:hypothetical protein